jgi:hypothetical protein
LTDVPIIEVPINDEKFRAFYELFKEYSEKLDEQPAAWKKLNEAIGRATPNAGKVSGAFSDTSDSSDAVIKSLTASTKAMKDLFAATQKTNASMSVLLNSSTGVAKGIFDAASGFGGIKKALGFLSAVPGVGSAVRAAGLAVGTVGALGDLAFHSARDVSSTARAAFGANASYGQFQNTQAQLSPFLPNPGGSLQSVAAAQYNPMAWGQLGLFGVSPRQSSQSAMATILKQAVGSLRTSHNTMLPQVKYAESLLGVSDTDLISLVNQNPRDLNSAIQAMLNPRLAGKQNVPGSIISSDQKLLQSWATSMNTASAKFAAALAPMNPIVASFGQDVAGFAGAVDKLVQATSGAAQNVDKTVSEGGLIQNNLPIAFGGKGNGPGGIKWSFGNLFPSASKVGGTNFASVMKQYMAAGYSRNFAAAMASNFNSESGFYAGAASYDARTGWHKGLGQWSSTRRAQILKGTGIDVWTDTNPSDQITASIWELRNTQKGPAAKIAAAANGRYGSAGAGAIAGDRYYEASGDNLFQQGVRGMAANLYASIGPGHTAAFRQATTPPPDPGVALWKKLTHSSGADTLNNYYQLAQNDLLPRNKGGLFVDPAIMNPQPTPKAPSATDAATAALLRRLAKQNIIKVQAIVTNNTAARVNMSANAAVR